MIARAPQALDVEAEARALLVLFPHAAELHVNKGKATYPHDRVTGPPAVSADRIAQHLRGEGPSLSFAVADWHGITGRVAVIDVDEFFAERMAVLGDVLRAEGLGDATIFTEGSAEGRGKCVVVFAREQHRTALHQFARGLVSKAKRDARWIEDRSERIDIRPHRAEVAANGTVTRPGQIRLLGHHSHRAPGRVERAWTVDGERAYFRGVVPSERDLQRTIERPNRRKRVHEEALPIAKAPLHRPVQRARQDGIPEHLASHKELRRFLLHVGREALRLYGDTPEAKARFYAWAADMRENTPWASSSFKSPTTGRRGDPLRLGVLDGTWRRSLAWWAKRFDPPIFVTSQTSRNCNQASASDSLPVDAHASNTDSEATSAEQPSSLERKPRAYDVTKIQAKRAERYDRLLGTLQGIALAKGLDPRCFGLDYRTLAAAAGVTPMMAHRDVKALVKAGRLVLHDLGLSKGHIVADADAPTGIRIGLRAVVGVVPVGSTPDAILALGAQRQVVQSQRARVRVAKEGFAVRRIVAVSPNVASFAEKRRQSALVIRSPELAGKLADVAQVLRFSRDERPESRPTKLAKRHGGRWTTTPDSHVGYCTPSALTERYEPREDGPIPRVIRPRFEDRT